MVFHMLGNVACLHVFFACLDILHIWYHMSLSKDPDRKIAFKIFSLHPKPLRDNASTSNAIIKHSGKNHSNQSQ